ncbi:hypothetical protein NM208_g4911 [Fusarium decemcellulare]|uniref:Uncharacterized protein n=1 Tax=Fusarium decemcellulare TaxID=57161 RepID=A0ACC1SIY8_9HYPO|nr:hypothetical protein NM208_g4911 [Fusarium decemcellulare]
MTIWDFFEFDQKEYAQRISHYDTTRLREQEVVKTRQHSAAVCSMVSGVAGAALSGGGTLILSAYGTRRYHVASEKLEAIQAELTKRGIPLHQVQKRDYLIPITASCISFGVGLGVEEIAMGVTNTLPMASGLPTGSSVTQALTTNSGATITGVAHGMLEQGREVGNAILNANNGIPASQDLARATVWVPAGSAQEATGFQAGMATMQTVEKGGASLASNILATITMGAFDGKARDDTMPHTRKLKSDSQKQKAPTPVTKRHTPALASPAQHTQAKPPSRVRGLFVLLIVCAWLLCNLLFPVFAKLLHSRSRV